MIDRSISREPITVKHGREFDRLIRLFEKGTRRGMILVDPVFARYLPMILNKIEIWIGP